MYISSYKEEDIKCKLIGSEKCSVTTITFPKDKYDDERYQRYLLDMKNNPKIHKIIKIENDEEEVIFEK